MFQNHSGRVNSSWPVNASVQDQYSLCDSTVPDDKISVSRKELRAMQTKLAVQEQELAACSIQADQTQSHLVASNGRSDGTVDNVLPDITVNADQPASCKTVPSDSERRKDVQDETHCVRESEQFKDQLSTLRNKVTELSSRVRQADNTIALLKQQIQLNTQSDGSSSPGLNPDLIIALANEIERLNIELDGHRRRPKLAVGGSSANHSCDEELCNDQSKPGISRRSCIPVKSGSAQYIQGVSLDGTNKVQAEQLNDYLEQGNKAGEKSTNSESTDVPLSPVTSHLPGQDIQNLHTILTGMGNVSGIAVDSLLSSAEMHNVSVQPSLNASSFECGLNVSADNQTPFNTLTFSNRQAFRELQAEVERLRRRLELTELENSRLQEMSRRNSMALSFLGTAGTKLSDGPKGVNDEMHALALPNVETDEVTMSTGFLKNLVEVIDFYF